MNDKLDVWRAVAKKVIARREKRYPALYSRINGDDLIEHIASAALASENKSAFFMEQVPVIDAIESVVNNAEQTA